MCPDINLPPPFISLTYLNETDHLNIAFEVRVCLGKDMEKEEITLRSFSSKFNDKSVFFDELLPYEDLVYFPNDCLFIVEYSKRKPTPTDNEDNKNATFVWVNSDSVEVLSTWQCKLPEGEYKEKIAGALEELRTTNVWYHMKIGNIDYGLTESSDDFMKLREKMHMNDRDRPHGK